MKKRYSFIKDFQELNREHHQAVLSFAVHEAKRLDVHIKICVQTKANCTNILERIFDIQTINRLKGNQPVCLDEVEITLATLKTLKKEFHPSERWVYLLLFPSPDLLNIVEALGNFDSLILFSETIKSDHLVSWQSTNQVHELEYDPST